uniref:Secreted protein n=1 Tax=Plectus sambesii TaxID=2011161 RepID=A0A914XN29_9BILA
MGLFLAVARAALDRSVISRQSVTEERVGSPATSSAGGRSSKVQRSPIPSAATEPKPQPTTARVVRVGSFQVMMTARKHTTWQRYGRFFSRLVAVGRRANDRDGQRKPH